jgi:hypothetical protein
MRRPKWGGRSFLLFATALAVSCGDDESVDDRPTYEVSGAVRRADGTPLSNGFVELHFFRELECGTTPVYGSSFSRTDAAGRYHAQQLAPGAVLTGCFRVTASGGSDPMSEPRASMDTVVQEVAVIEGETNIKVDLTVP